MTTRHPLALRLGALALVVLPLAATAQEARLGNELQVNVFTQGTERGPAVAMDAGGTFVVVWFGGANQDGAGYGIFGRRFSNAGAPLGGELLINTFTTGNQFWPDVAATTDGGFLVVWESEGQDGSERGIFGRRFSSTAAPLASEFQVNSYSSSAQYKPSIDTGANGAFVVAWVSIGQDGEEEGVFARQFSSAGVALAGEFQVNTYTGNYQGMPDVSIAGEGDFVIAWASIDQDGSDYGIFARRFSSAGSPLDIEFQVNGYTSSLQVNPSVAIDGDGDFIVAWDGYRDSSGRSVTARRYSSAGAALGVELKVNVNTLGSPAAPSLGLENDGDFVVAWQSYVDGDSIGVFARRFSSAGDAPGADFQVNTYTLSAQYETVLALAGSRFVIAWSSLDQDGLGGGIFAQRFAVPVIFDIDGNGAVDPLTDALLGLRYTFGFRGAVLIGGAVAAGCTRCDAPSIEAYLAGLVN